MSISLVRLVVFVNLRGVLILTTNLNAIWKLVVLSGAKRQ